MKARCRLGAVVATVTTLASVTQAAGAYQRPGETLMVSEGGAIVSGTPPIGEGYVAGVDLSSNGRFVAFDSNAQDVMRGDVNLSRNVFVRDLQTGAIEISSVSSQGARGLGGCNPTNPTDLSSAFDPAISATGRWVVFVSCYINLVPGDTNLAADIFLHDRKSKTTERVNVSGQGTEAALGQGSSSPVVSRNGRYVAFGSNAPNLVENDTNDISDVFVRDRLRGTTERVSVASDGSQATAGPAAVARAIGGVSSFAPSLSGDGRYVAFSSSATNLVAGDSNESLDVFVHDRKTKKMERVSVASGGPEAQRHASGPFGGSSTYYSGDRVRHAISADGRYVTFYSDATNLVPSNGNSLLFRTADAYVHDRKTGRTERVSVNSKGQEGERSFSALPSLSADGRHVVFMSYYNWFPFDHGDFFGARSLGAGDPDVFIYDRAMGSLEMASVATDGSEARRCSWDHPERTDPETSYSTIPAVSSDGRLVAFRSCSDTLVTDDTNNGTDAFLRDRGRALGAGGFGREGLSRDQGGDPGDRICVQSNDLCIPPLGWLSAPDAVGDSPAIAGTDLIEVSVAYRPQHQDLFVAQELERMPRLGAGAPGVASAASSHMVYGLRFTARGNRYEVHASSLLGGTFGLFDCTRGPACVKATDIEGGYGTTGERIVFSLPLVAIGLDRGGRISNVEAFSALGSFGGGLKKLDSVQVK